MGRDTIGGFFHHSEVPSLDVANLADRSVYKYTAEPKVSRVTTLRSEPTSFQAEPPSSSKFNIYFYLWKLNEWIGLRHLFMIFLVVAFTSIGAYIFYIIESKNEELVYPVRVTYLNNKVLAIAQKFKDNRSWNVTQVSAEFKKDYIGMLTFDNVYKWSVYYRTEVQYKWNPWSATFFAINIHTTVGYETVLGIWMVILYILLFCPVTMVISRDLGQFGLVYLTKLYGYVRYRISSNFEKKKISADDLIILPVKYGWVAMFVFLGMTTVFLYYYDGLTGPDVGLSWWECFYFSVQTYTTAGFGDIMPINVTFDPIVGLVYFFCLPILKVVNRMSYLYMENGIHGFFAIVESKINIYLNSTYYPDRSVPPGNDGQPTYSNEHASQEDEWANNFTIQSLAAMASSTADVYGGHLGRVDLRTQDLQPCKKPSSAAA